jgi:hypothetical protein
VKLYYELYFLATKNPTIGINNPTTIKTNDEIL